MEKPCKRRGDPEGRNGRPADLGPLWDRGRWRTYSVGRDVQPERDAGESPSRPSGQPKQPRSRPLLGAGEELTPEAAQVADAIMELPHVVAADRIGAERIGMLLVQIGRVEAALADGHVESRKGAPRRLLDQHRRLNGELREWLDRFGLTPKGRSDWAGSLLRWPLTERDPSACRGRGLNRRGRQAVLEAIIEAPGATIGDRLKALELLREFDDEGRPPFADRGGRHSR